MPTPASLRKRAELQAFVARKLVADPAVHAVIAVGGIATGLAHDRSDIDAYVFLDPFDPYIVPAEAIWRASDDTFHSIFSDDDALERDGVQLDFKRIDLSVWRDTDRSWPAPVLAELAAGWVAFDRQGDVARLIAERATYSDDHRSAQLDDAITWLDQHLGGGGVALHWTTLWPALAHDRLQAAYDYLVQALFAYNRRWRSWRNRELDALVALPWLPADFERLVLTAAVAPGHDERGYQQRAMVLTQLFAAVLRQLQAEGVYGADPIGEAFIRSHDEPGRAWNMEQWNAAHRMRTNRANKHPSDGPSG